MCTVVKKQAVQLKYNMALKIYDMLYFSWTACVAATVQEIEYLKEIYEIYLL